MEKNLYYFYKSVTYETYENSLRKLLCLIGKTDNFRISLRTKTLWSNMAVFTVL